MFQVPGRSAKQSIPSIPSTSEQLPSGPVHLNHLYSKGAVVGGRASAENEHPRLSLTSPVCPLPCAIFCLCLFPLPRIHAVVSIYIQDTHYQIPTPRPLLHHRPYTQLTRAENWKSALDHQREWNSRCQPTPQGFQSRLAISSRKWGRSCT